MFFWIFLISIHLSSLIFLTISITRLRDYAAKHSFEESKYTMLFDFVRLPHVVVIYIGGMTIWIALTVLYSIMILNG